MSSSIYTKLAWTNLKNNHKTYVPYILTSLLTVMMFYIMDALSQTDEITNVSLKLLLEYAVGVIVVFAVIFLFYTNSFLIKRRKKEIGVYNILGMGKRHIAKMLIVETLIVMAVSLGAGLLAGIVFGKLMYLLLQKLLRYDLGIHFSISGIAIQQTVLLFVVIFSVILIYNLMQIRLANPIELLHAGNQGEKEPKTKWLLAVIGVVTIAIGYGIAIVVEKPLEALGGFFIAVICVIIGTYALFTAGSIAILKMLKKNKKYYYQTNHFTAVSGMIFRMKQNAAGLANICILSTMVLVMVSTTFSLYMGMEDILDYRFPQEVSITTAFENDEKTEQIEQIVKEELSKEGLIMEKPVVFHGTWMTAFQEEDGFVIEDVMDYTERNVCDLTLMALEDYNSMEHVEETLNNDEVFLYAPNGYDHPTVQIGDKTYNVKEVLDEVKAEKNAGSATVDGYYVIFSDRNHVQEIMDFRNSIENVVPSAYTTRFRFDMTVADNIGNSKVSDTGKNVDMKSKGELKEAKQSAVSALEQAISQQYGDTFFESRVMGEKTFYELYGVLLFIGIYLGVMFLMATVLIIYYKQISEGYDDRERYQIMQKVGMSRIEVKRSIRSQVLIVFFLPLVTAIIHNLVAFRIVNKLLHTLNFTNAPLYMMCTVVTICIFAVFYAIVYAITAKEYYKIVN